VTLHLNNHSDIVLKVNNLSHYYGQQCVLHNISLFLPKGATLGVIGPDGAGKSTLLSLISGIKSIQRGTIVALGADLGRALDRTAIQSEVAFMPQGLGRKLYPTLSVFENVDFSARVHKINSVHRAKRIFELLEATGLGRFHERKAHQLSGGMKQKLALCCSLIQAPNLLILDEPTTGVDPLSRRQFWDLVDWMKAENSKLSIIVATSNFEESNKFDYITALDNGAQLITGEPVKILQDTGSKTIEGAYNSLLADWRKLETKEGAYSAYDRNQPIVIEAKNLTKNYGEFVAVDNVNFNITRGEIFGFIGPNGCGKSTTIKMLTGLLDSTFGEAELFGKRVIGGDLETRYAIGYMSQNYSLYEELTIEGNLRLHCGLYKLDRSNGVDDLIHRSLETFDLLKYASSFPKNVPLGIRQRLQLAVACLHNPKILVLDEPTSGVDPIAREVFWQHIYRLSRDENVTVFITTHYMNEAEKCDRVSLMYGGKILTIGSPDEICQKKNVHNLDSAFISYLEDERAVNEAALPQVKSDEIELDISMDKFDYIVDGLSKHFGYDVGYVWAIIRREFVELSHDKMRLAFSVFGPVFLLIVTSLCISFDLQKVRFSVIDRDQSYMSRKLIEAFDGNTYLESMELDEKESSATYLNNHNIQLLIEIPENYGRNLLKGNSPEVGIFIDSTVPILSNSIRALADGIILNYQISVKTAATTRNIPMPVSIEDHYTFNQEFESIIVITPGALMLSLFLIPTMMTALGIVREKEIGTIINFYSSEISPGAFLVGKQFPYIVLSLISFLLQLTIITLLFDVRVQGSILGLILGFVLFSFSATSLGLLISVLVNSQVAAIFGAAIICLTIATNFSGFLYPVSILTGMSYIAAISFPSTWFQFITVGAISKGETFSDLMPLCVPIILIGVIYFVASCSILGKQEA
jgi:ribosome-dependent ATPase